MREPNARARRAGARDVGAGDGQRVFVDVGGPHLGLGQRERQRERKRTGAGAEIRDRVRRERAGPWIRPADALAQPLHLRDRDLRDDLRLGARDEHPSVDQEVDAAEAP